jgi:hypothetical protein
MSYYDYNTGWFWITTNNTSAANPTSWIYVYTDPKAQFFPWPMIPKTITPDPSDPTRVLEEEEQTIKRSTPAGQHVCSKCNEKNEYAEPNQSDGSYICYNCRNKL